MSGSLEPTAETVSPSLRLKSLGLTVDLAAVTEIIGDGVGTGKGVAEGPPPPPPPPPPPVAGVGLGVGTGVGVELD